MEKIGFATKFYTLWDVTIENFTNEYGRKGTTVTAVFIKNISTDLDKVRAKYPRVEVDMSLRGHSSWRRTYWEPLPEDVFPCGKYQGQPIAQCCDFGYLFWAVKNYMLDGVRAEIAEDVLINSGEYAYYDGEIMTAEDAARMEAEDAVVGEFITDIKERGAVRVCARTNVQLWDSKDLNCYDEDKQCWLYERTYGSDTAVERVKLEWPEYMLKYFSYGGFDYWLPVRNGKGKKIKGQILQIVPDSYRVEGRYLYITVRDFTIIK